LIPQPPTDCPRRPSPRAVFAWFAAAALILSTASCEQGPRQRRSTGRFDSAAPYQAEVEEGLGAAVAILVDTSGSMDEQVPGDARPKSHIAREALAAMLDATDALMARRPGFEVKVGLYSFSSSTEGILPIRPYDRAVLHDALARLPQPGGGTAIGEAMRAARPDLYRAGVFRKYLLVVTDGENTTGRSPDDVAREIFSKSEGGVQIYFVAFDTNPDRFGFLKDVGGDVIAAGTGAELRGALDAIYQGRILAEVEGAGERAPAEP
jgi:Mg-chelatase subunit ChlD